MRSCPLFFLLLVAVSWAADPQVEVRGNEVWLIANGRTRQLTSDGRSKLQAVLSPSNTQIAYYEQCPQGENCIPSVIILDLQGKRLKTFQPMAGALPPAEPCASILDISWMGENGIAVECHINPSVSEYVETDLGSGKTVKDLLGYGFTPSPDRRYVAHVAPFIHFAPPIAQSNYLQLDKITVYPLPKGAKPTEEKPEVVRQRGSTWIGVHEFSDNFFWSPDSERTAFVDCLFDWIEKDADRETLKGDPANRRCFVAVVARNGQSQLFPISETSVRDQNMVNFIWNGPRQLSAQLGGQSRTFRVR